MCLLAVAMSFFGVQTAKGELLLYISDGTLDPLIIQDNDEIYDTNDDAGTMFLNVTQLQSYFPGWNFGAYFTVFSNLTEIDGRPNQVVNIDFEATNNTGSSANLEVLAMYIGSNGRVEPTTLQMYGGARTNQLTGLTYTFIGSYSQNETDSFYTNGYNEESGPVRYVRETAPPGSEVDNELVLDLNLEPSKSIVGDVTFALTYGVKITNLADGSRFGTASELGYALPEPASIATWAVAVGLVGLAGKRKRKIRTL